MELAEPERERRKARKSHGSNSEKHANKQLRMLNFSVDYQGTSVLQASDMGSE